MVIKQLGISGFRNLNKVDSIDLPEKGLLVAAAPNAIGKTNFLESLVVLLRGKSWRAKMSECIKWGEDSFTVWGDIKSGDSDLMRVAVRYYEPTRRLRIEEDGVPASVVSFYGRYPIVLFLPEDTFLLSRGPAQRRNFLNQVLVSHPLYLSALVQYQRALRQRNQALKKAKDFTDIASWTQIVIEHGKILMRHRAQLIQFMDNNLSEWYVKLSGERRSFEVSNLPSVKHEQRYEDVMIRAFSRENRFGYTLNGPHRDSFLILSDDREVTTMLSRGQTRSLVIAMKVVAHQYIKHLTKEEPLLLLDDVLSELDEHRQKVLLEHLESTQALLTTTTVPTLLRKRENAYLLDLRSIIQQEASPGRGAEENVVEELLEDEIITSNEESETEDTVVRVN